MSTEECQSLYQVLRSSKIKEEMEVGPVDGDSAVVKMQCQCVLTKHAFDDIVTEDQVKELVHIDGFVVDPAKEVVCCLIPLND